MAVGAIIIIDHNGNNHHIIRIRWDVAAGEELFVEYGEEFWKEHYWSNPERVRCRYPSIISNYLPPAEGEDPRFQQSEELVKA